MKQYKKPLMKIVELEKVDVLTASCPVCHSQQWTGGAQHSAEDGCDPNCTAHDLTESALE